jgi:hypothetical protein
MKIDRAQELFEIRHSGRNLQVWRRGKGHFKQYLGAINGDVCAMGPAKGDLLRRLVEMSRHYPMAPPRRRVARPKRR